MGGPGSGGVRSGAPGRAYSNRTDLNSNRVPIQTATNQPYGRATAQRNAQRAIPLSTPPPIPTPSPQTAIPGSPPNAPPASIPFSAPTNRPGEPVTSGLPIGSGPGPESLFMPGGDTTSLQIRALYAMYPNNDLLSLIEEMDAGQTF